MKLNQKKVHWIIRQKQKGVGTKEIAWEMKVSRRRVQQIWKYLKETGKEPILGQKVGRPKKPYIRSEAEIVREAHSRYKFGARMLERVIRKQYKIFISHNRIHMHLKKEGLAHEEPGKKRRRKWNRYERKHSLSAGHIDWYGMKWTDLISRSALFWMMHPGRSLLVASSLVSTLRTANWFWIKSSIDTGGFIL
jgi:putative transposase